jgi:uncharacterized protein (TIGR02246 family)
MKVHLARKSGALLLFAALSPALATAQQSTAEILAVIEKSADDWNRGDLEAFVQGYEQSPETTFVGTEISKGAEALLGRYRRVYPDVEHMGKTTFSELDARPLTPELAIVTGRFHLTRDVQWGGDKSGLFTLVMRKGDSGWRIIHDHTSSTN